MHAARLRFTVTGIPQPKGSTRAFVPKGWTRPVITSDNRSLKAWEHVIRAELQRVMSETAHGVLVLLFHAPIRITLTFAVPRPKSLPRRTVYPTKKPDCDKLARAAIDALNGLLFKDDAQVVAIVAQKVYAHTAPHVDIFVEAVDLLDTDHPPSRDSRGVLPYGDAAR